MSLNIYTVFLEDFYQQDPSNFTETTIEEVDPITGAKYVDTAFYLYEFLRSTNKWYCMKEYK